MGGFDPRALTCLICPAFRCFLAPFLACFCSAPREGSGPADAPEVPGRCTFPYLGSLGGGGRLTTTPSLLPLLQDWKAMSLEEKKAGASFSLSRSSCGGAAGHRLGSCRLSASCSFGSQAANGRANAPPSSAAALDRLPRTPPLPSAFVCLLPCPPAFYIAYGDYGARRPKSSSYENWVVLQGIVAGVLATGIIWNFFRYIGAALTLPSSLFTDRER